MRHLVVDPPTLLAVSLALAIHAAPVRAAPVPASPAAAEPATRACLIDGKFTVMGQTIVAKDCMQAGAAETERDFKQACEGSRRCQRNWEAPLARSTT